ncbi:aspartate aminotransferase family protein [Thermopetrobacter sp. TC1]|uniref:aspartate aminotransferase family protein n=1 Tax=Thermopetrobacter sp. TC1 TaxID=1495045 RepID=UPI00056F81E6|nr:aspartate aminotransferase family protein [Thermopetrobacter sp. TC1]
MTSPVMPTYARHDVAFVRGEGARLWSEDGREFIDFGAGVAVTSFGHAHPHLVEALCTQARKLWHVSNLYRIPEGERLARRLIAASGFAETVFFANSGAEALEAAIKTARSYHFENGQPERQTIITFQGCFHGRTLATIAAGRRKAHTEAFGEACPGFMQLALHDYEAVARAVNEKTAAILIEPVQGEGGVRVVEAAFLEHVRSICDETGTLLIYDEVQCGMGRTGRMFAHEWAGVKPDIMALAKALGGGFPIGACLATAEAAKGMTAGRHGSTFGGNPLAMAVGNAVMDILENDTFLPEVRRKAERLQAGLGRLAAAHGAVFKGVRGIGMMLGLACAVPNTEVTKAALDEGVLVIGAADNVVRVMPPLVITAEEMDEGLVRLERAAMRLAAQ